jgi:hypothetical protein
MLNGKEDMDTYFIGLVAGSLYNVGRYDDARKLASELVKH